jgi:hypothetical protein
MKFRLKTGGKTCARLENKGLMSKAQVNFDKNAQEMLQKSSIKLQNSSKVLHETSKILQHFAKFCKKT